MKIKQTVKMNDNKVYVIRCYDMGSSSIDGIYDTFDKADEHIQILVIEINSRLLKKKDEFQTLFEKQESSKDGDVLVRYRNNLRVMEIMQFEINKPYDDFITWYD